MSTFARSAVWITPLFAFGALNALASETDKWYRSPTFLGRGGAGLADPRAEDAIFSIRQICMARRHCKPMSPNQRPFQQRGWRSKPIRKVLKRPKRKRAR